MAERGTTGWAKVRRAVAVAGLVLGTGGLVLPAPALGDSAEVGSYTATSRADGLVIRFVDPAIPAVPEGRIENTSSSAQALIDSFGASRAFASAPYVELAATLPETIAGFSNGQLSLPSYPFIVFSDHPTTPEAKQDNGPYALHAASTAGSSSAETRSGASSDAAQAFSFTTTAVAKRDDTTGVVNAASRNTTTGVALADVLRIGSVASGAEVTQSPGEGPKKATAFEVTGFNVGGVALTVKEDGIHLADTTLPNVDMTAVTAALAERGVTLTYLPKVETETGILAAGLEVMYRTEVPGQGPVTVAVVFGRASAAIASAGSGLTPLPGFGPDGTSVIFPPAGSEPGPVESTDPAADGSETSAGAADGSPLGELAAGLPGTGTAAVTGPAAGAPAPAQARPGTVAPPRFVSGGLGRVADSRWASSFYAVVVLASVVVLAGGRVLGVLGVRLGRSPAVPAALSRPVPTLRLPPD
jgi:hypothetical protein